MPTVSPMSRRWSGAGPDYTIEWGGRSWTLAVGDRRPGLRTGHLGPLLALEGVAAVGRRDPEALSGATLVRHEVRLGRVEATYSPPGWGEMTVRAAWGPSGVDGMDLEIELSARSVDELKAVEVLAFSLRLADDPAGSPTALRVEPRDARSAALSYDGREPELSGLRTMPPRASAPGHPYCAGSDRDPGHAYAEMAHPEDVSRRLFEYGTEPPGRVRAIHYGLLGHDLERGVVLRARLRALWLPATPDAGRVADERFAEFLREPPPLTT